MKIESARKEREGQDNIGQCSIGQDGYKVMKLKEETMQAMKTNNKSKTKLFYTIIVIVISIKFK